MNPMLLSEIRRDDKFEGFLIVRSAEQRASANGKNYLDMTLADRSGSPRGEAGAQRLMRWKTSILKIRNVL